MIERIGITLANLNPRKVPKVPINEPSPIGGRIAWHMENTLVRFVKRIFNAIGDGLRSVIAYALEEFVDLVEDQTTRLANPIIDDMLKSGSLPNSVRHALTDAKRPGHAAQWKVQIFAMIAGIVSLGNAYFSAWGRLVTYSAEQEAQSHRPSPVDILLMERLNAIGKSEVDVTLKDIGVADRYVIGYSALLEQLLPEQETMSAWLRGDISELDVDEIFRKKGYAPFAVDILKKLTKVIPGPQDLIRMAVREAFNDPVAKTFGYDDDFPPEFAEWAEKVGITPFWAEKFWRAHWELPGVRQGFEMFHRRIIKEDELKLLLRSLDIPSFWREGLIQLSYNPYTRVDVRRMYNLGVVSRDEVFENYLDLGYSPERAEKLTEWTVLEYGESNRDLTKGDILGAYSDNTINEQETTSILSDLGYDDNEIALLLTRADLKREARYEKEFVENVRVAYVGRSIDRADVISKLNSLNPPSGFVDERLALWDLQRDRQVTIPAKADLKAFFQQGIINEETVATELRKRNYQEYSIEWYIQLWQGSPE